MTAILAWLSQNKTILLSVLLTVGVALNAQFGWLNAETVTLIVTVAGSLGITVLHLTANAARAAAADAHLRLDMSETPRYSTRNW